MNLYKYRRAADSHHFNADLDPSFHVDTNPDPDTGLLQRDAKSAKFSLLILQGSILIRRIRMFSGLPDPDILVRGTDPDPDQNPDPSLFS